MAKPDPALLDAARYPFSSAIEPRFGDLDIYRHINNVAMAGMIEDGRVRFHHHAGLRKVFVDVNPMVASFQIDYLGEGRYPDAITMHCAMEGIGRTSYRVISLATQNDHPVALARTTIVMVGPNGPSTLPDRFREILRPWMLGA